MSAEAQEKIVNSFDQHFYQFFSLVESHLINHPSETDLIYQQACRYVNNVTNFLGSWNENHNHTPNFHPFLSHDVEDVGDIVSHVHESSFDVSWGYGSSESFPYGTSRSIPGESTTYNAQGTVTAHNGLLPMFSASVRSLELTEDLPGTTTTDPMWMHLDATSSAPLNAVPDLVSWPIENRHEAQNALPGPSTRCRTLKRLQSSSDMRRVGSSGNLARPAPLCQGMWNPKRRRLQRPVRAPSLATVSKLCFSIVCSTVMMRLKALISALRTSEDVNMNCNIQDLPTIFQALDHIEVVHQSQALRRGLLLCRFANFRDQLFDHIRIRRDTQDPKKKQTGVRSVESEVKDSMMREIYPYTAEYEGIRSMSEWRKDYESERKQIDNRMQAAKFWKEAVQRFQIGVLILVSSTENFCSRSYKYENLRDCERNLLFAALAEKDNGCLMNASALLTPLVRAVNDGNEYPTKLSIEAIEENMLEKIDCSTVLALLAEAREDEMDAIRT